MRSFGTIIERFIHVSKRTQKVEKKLYISYSLIALGLIGGFLFFPFNFDDRYTCVYHRMMHRSPRPQNHHLPQADTGRKNRTTFPSMRRHMAMERMGIQQKEWKNQPIIWQKGDVKLLGRYIFPFGIIWWMSIVLLVFGCYELKKHRRTTGKSKEQLDPGDVW